MDMTPCIRLYDFNNARHICAICKTEMTHVIRHYDEYWECPKCKNQTYQQTVITSDSGSSMFYKFSENNTSFS